MRRKRRSRKGGGSSFIINPFGDGTQLYDESIGPKPKVHRPTLEWVPDVYDAVDILVSAEDQIRRNLAYRGYEVMPTGGRSKGASPLKRYEYRKLLQEWGFKLKPQRGRSHSEIWEGPKGGIACVSTSGNWISMHDIRHAAQAVGVNVHNFVLGPKEALANVAVDEADKTITASAVGLAMIARPLIETTESAFGLSDLEAEAKRRALEKEERMKKDRLSEQVRRAFERQPDRPLRNSEVAKEIGVPISEIHGPIARLMGTGVLRRVESGMHQFAKAPPPRAMPNQVTDALMHFCRAHENSVFSAEEATKWIWENIDPDVKRDTVAVTLNRLSERASGIEKVGRGRYRYIDPKEEPVQAAAAVTEYLRKEEPPAPEPPKAPVPTVKASDSSPIFEIKAELGDNRFVVVDADGQVWLARMQRLDV